jgi:hypothetical protein
MCRLTCAREVTLSVGRKRVDHISLPCGALAPNGLSAFQPATHTVRSSYLDFHPRTARSVERAMALGA